MGATELKAITCSISLRARERHRRSTSLADPFTAWLADVLAAVIESLA